MAKVETDNQCFYLFVKTKQRTQNIKNNWMNICLFHHTSKYLMEKIQKTYALFYSQAKTILVKPPVFLGYRHKLPLGNGALTETIIRVGYKQ